MNFTTQSEYSDICLVSADGMKLYFSKYVLYHSSEYFKRLLNGGFKESNKDEIKLEKSFRCLSNLLRLLTSRQALYIDEMVVRETFSAILEYLLDNIFVIFEDNVLKREALSLESLINLSTEFNLLKLRNSILDPSKYHSDIWENIKLNLVNLEFIRWFIRFDTSILFNILERIKQDSTLCYSMSKVAIMIPSCIYKTKNKEQRKILISYLMTAGPSQEKDEKMMALLE